MMSLPVCSHVHWVGGGFWSRGDMALPPVNRLADKCENITFPQLRLRPVRKIKSATDETGLKNCTRPYDSSILLTTMFYISSGTKRLPGTWKAKQRTAPRFVKTYRRD